MKIKNVRLIEFKRFTDLTITDIPETTRLVILVGPNGSGKSSVFDGFNVQSNAARGGVKFLMDYHLKSGAPIPDDSSWYLLDKNKVRIEFHDAPHKRWNELKENDITRFYIRTGYRYEPDFTVSTISKQGIMTKEANQPDFLTSIESRVSKNYQRLIAQTVAAIYNQESDENATIKEIRGRIIGDINSSFQRVLPNVKFIGLGDPLSNGTFLFEKGSSKDWQYKNLSAGEKATFDLILDFIVKSPVFNNTVYCIDEPEVHINTNVHSALLEELYSSLPGESQLWIATHSASMMQKAREIEEKNPGTVVFLDFGENDFDQPVTIRPAITDRMFWQRNFSVAMGELAELVAPTQVFFCEGDPKGADNREFDAKCYSNIFTIEFPNSVFISVGSSKEVRNKSEFLSGVFSQFLKGVKVTSIIDRDDCLDEEREAYISKGDRMLTRRHLEAYLLDDEILKKFCINRGKEEVWPQLKFEKSKALAKSVEVRNNPIDDWKSVGGEIRVAAKKLLGIAQIGGTTENFILGHLVPLITPDTEVYRLLKNEIFG